MTRLVAAELFKLRTTRTFAAMVGATFALLLLLVVLSLALSDSFNTENDVRSVLSSASLSGLFMLVLGVVAGAGEYRHGTIASTLLVTPQRLRAVSGSVVACFLGGLAIGLAAAGFTAIVALPWLSAKDAVMPSTGTTLGIFLGGAAYAALAAALGAALGALLRSQVAAVVIVLILIFVVDPAVAALFENAGKFTLTGLGIAMSGGHGDAEALSRGVAAVVWALYTILLGALAVVVTARRDV